jgi:hypothetical protein
VKTRARLGQAAVLLTVVIAAAGSLVTSWYLIGDQTDWSAFSGPTCEFGTCGPDDFAFSELDYTVRPWQVSDAASTAIEIAGLAALVVSLGALALLTAIGRVPWRMWWEIGVVCLAAYLVAALLRSATAAAIGAIIFGGVDVLLIPVVVAITAVICFILYYRRRAAVDAR